MEFSNVFVSAGTAYSTYEKGVPSPYFRKSFVVDKKAEDAQITITGLGFYALFVNGKEITKGLLAPYISNPDHVVYYDTYSLADYLQEGENVIGVQLGNGLVNNLNPVWKLDAAPFRSAPKFACKVVCGDLAFDALDFKWAYSPLYFDGLREGNFYDARKELTGWNAPGFDDSAWQAPVLAEIPRGEKKLCEAEPVTKQEEIKPVRVFKGTLSENQNNRKELYPENQSYMESEIPRTGGYIYDFGKNLTGISRLKIKGKPGQKIRLQYYDRLKGTELDRRSLSFYPDGFAQSDVFICSGGEDVFEQRFAYYGYQYCYVWGITEEQATEDLLTAIDAHSDIPKIGSFSCSDADANQLYEIVQRSDITNFYYFLNDCPHREKNGWTGDSAMSAEHVILNYDADKNWREWLLNIRKSQADDGRLPGIVPTDEWGFAWGNGPAWDSVLFNLPYMLYIYRKDTDVIRENAHAMLRYLEYISENKTDAGTVELGLGDWAPVGGNFDKYTAPLELTDSLMVMDICKKAAEMFDAVGLTLSRDFAQALYQDVREATRKKCIDFADMTVVGDCQSSQAMAIYYDLFEESEKEQAFQILLKIVHRDNDSMQGGFLGLRVLFHVLAELGEADLAYHMICKREYPSYGQILDLGFTTLPEQFWEDYTDARISVNHHFFGDISHWFVRQVAGICVEKDRIFIKPHFIKKLDFAQASYELPNGNTLFVRWERTETGIRLCVTGAKAEIVLPRGFVMKKEDWQAGQFEIEEI